MSQSSDQNASSSSSRGATSDSGNSSAAFDSSAPSQEQTEQEQVQPQVEQQQEQPKEEQAAQGKFWRRVKFGSLAGVLAFGGLLMGSWLFTVLLTGVVLLGTAEYFNLVNARAKLLNVAAPSRLSVYIGCIGCAIMPLIAMVNGGLLTPGAKFAGGLLLAMLLTQPRRPRWSQFTGYVCGLFYCGFLPSFWVTLRCGLGSSAATTTSPVARLWPALLGGSSLWTTGLVAIFMGFAGVIAADTGAYLGGKSFGKTPLIELSPKKTVEGAVFGLASAICVSVVLSMAFSWPPKPISAAVLGVIVFASSLFGDLFESALKRQAGVKDAGSLIPGHGGILDRTDSYIFTAPAIYLFIRYVLPKLA
ncbi:hypothetical protein CLOM_g3870 [Closterium sp. NIES-68]|nr:hypothetical protein CLOM_g3870 [Closterium sp. NIES-68]GJP66848.1 hypothetical protein CLOP_g23734 [Closterium sp. NIES-67]